MFIDRTDAANQLLERLKIALGTAKAVILAIPRGGLVLGTVLAKALKAPLDVILAKKIGAPHNPELAIGAATQSFFFVQPPYQLKDFEHQAAIIQEKLRERAQIYHQNAHPITLNGTTVVIVDDGIATGHTMYAAIKEVKKQMPRYIIVAAPVISAQTRGWLVPEVDKIISVIEPEDLQAIGAYYQHFDQIDDNTALKLLKSSQKNN